MHTSNRAAPQTMEGPGGLLSSPSVTPPRSGHRHATGRNTSAAGDLAWPGRLVGDGRYTRQRSPQSDATPFPGAAPVVERARRPSIHEHETERWPCSSARGYIHERLRSVGIHRPDTNDTALLSPRTAAERPRGHSVGFYSSQQSGGRARQQM